MRVPFIGQYSLTAFDYLAMIGFAINMAVILFIVVHWLSS